MTAASPEKAQKFCSSLNYEPAPLEWGVNPLGNALIVLLKAALQNRWLKIARIQSEEHIYIIEKAIVYGPGVTSLVGQGYPSLNMLQIAALSSKGQAQNCTSDIARQARYDMLNPSYEPKWFQYYKQVDPSINPDIIKDSAAAVIARHQERH